MAASAAWQPLLPGLGARALDGVLNRLCGEHTEDHGHARLLGNAVASARRRSSRVPGVSHKHASPGT